MGDTTREKWDMEKMREHKNDWSLATDIHLFSYMQQFSQNLLSETHGTLQALNSLESDIATTCVEVRNIGNRFWALSDTQFVENRVYDDDDVTSPVDPTSPQDTQTEDVESIVIQRLREAIQNGIQVLDSKFEPVQVPASDSDEDDSSPHSGEILKPVNRYRERRLPHIIGSAEFCADDTLGLRDALSDEETEDFLSASDKANESESLGESEDSDVESDQTKSKPVLAQKPNNIFDPCNLRIPGLEEIQRNSNISTPPTEDMPGEGEDLFSQMVHKKPMFSGWQASDLWAPEQEDDKCQGDDSSSNRPPSAASSLSSAQSSNVSEPIKKTSEDFGKSGTGRQAVLVQEDQDDLFGSKTSGATPPQAKKYVPAGGVKIFDGEFNPFPNKNSFKESESEDFAPVLDIVRPEKDDTENINFAKKQNMPTKVLPAVPNSNKFSKEKEVSLFDDEDEDLVPDKSSEPKPKPQPSSRANADDLFGSPRLFSESKAKLSHSLFKDDLFGDESEDLFSNIDYMKQTKEKTTFPQSSSGSLFSDQAPLDQRHETKSEVPSQKSKNQNFGKNLFGDVDDLFGNVSDLKGDDLFGDAPSSVRPPTGASTDNKQPRSYAPSSQIKDLFDESDNEDLFSSLPKNSKTDQNQTVNKDSLFGNKYTALSKSAVEKVEGNDFLGASRASSNIKQQPVKGKPLFRSKKGEKYSLFDSDSDDDLFSSPQGSLSSRKSVQSASGTAEPSEKEDKVKSSQDSFISRPPKTDFGSIFSGDQDETAALDLGKETGNSSNLFGEDVDLFSNSNLDVKTPDLFNSISSNPGVIGHVQASNRAIKENQNEIKIKTESEITEIETLIKTIKKDKSTTPIPVKRDIYRDEVTENEEKIAEVKKPEPPKSLDIKPILETLQGNQNELDSKSNEENTQEPSMSNPPPKVFTEKPSPKDTTDGEVVSPLTSSKLVPGKLKASQLIKINTAALLPGARPSKSDPQLSASEIKESLPKASPQDHDSEQTLSPSATHQNVLDIPPQSTLLQSVNKERVKIQGKRRPSSRRARQEALRASSLDPGTENEVPSIPSAASNLMSPSTDEEDLFGVPPLDVVYDVKAVSPSTDIFGTPTVLSPVTKKELPSSFVSTPFVHSQPPPLDEDQEDGSNQEEDLFGSDSNLLDSVTENNPPEIRKEIQSRKGISAEDIFGGVEDEGLFQRVREVPPPLVDDDVDDDDDDEYSGLFMTKKQKGNIFSKVTESSSVITALESSPKEDPLFSRPPHSVESVPNVSSSDPLKSKGLASDFTSSFKDSPVPKANILFDTAEEPEECPFDDSLFKKSIKPTILPEDSLFASNKSLKEPSDSSIDVSRHIESNKEEPLCSQTIKEEKLDTNVSSDLFSASDETFSRIKPDSPETKLKENHSSCSDDELFGSHSKPSIFEASSPGILAADKSKPFVKTKENERQIKKEALFDEDEDDVGNLFSPESDKKLKVKPLVKSSIFGDDEDDDDIFGTLSSSKRTETKPESSAIEARKGVSSRPMKTGSSGSSKLVKLETKQTFSDPLLSNEDQ